MRYFPYLTFLMYIALIGFTLLFFLLSLYRFSWALFLLFLLLPSYLLRFYIGPLPSTILEIMILCLITTHVAKNPIAFFSWLKHFFIHNKLLFVGILLFVTGATLGIFMATDMQKALGEWKAFYIEPVLLFFVMASYLSQHTEDHKKKIIEKYIVLPLILCGIGTSVLAIYQHFTGWMVPHSFWANRNTYRVTAWYGYPNAVGLFLAQLFCFAWYFFREKSSREKKHPFIFLSAVFVLAASAALVFAKGSGPILGVMAGVGVLFVLAKKTRKFALGLGIIGILALIFAPLPSSIQDELLFRDRSAQIRLSMWQETTELLKHSPFFGAGLASYSEKIAPYHKKVNGENIEIFHLPHNLFLSLWVNIGITGLLGFFCIIAWCFIQAYKQKNTLGLSAFVCSGLVTILVMGLVDTPYIKNDLAILFWVFPLLLLNKQITTNN